MSLCTKEDVSLGSRRHDLLGGVRLCIQGPFILRQEEESGAKEAVGEDGETKHRTEGGGGSGSKLRGVQSSGSDLRVYGMGRRRCNLNLLRPFRIHPEEDLRLKPVAKDTQYYPYRHTGK